MLGVTITDRKEDNSLAVNLVDILHLLGTLTEDTEWEISEVECLGAAADKMHSLSDRQARVSGQTLLDLAANLTQIIDGVFKGYRGSGEQPWITVQAVDSSAYDVESEDEKVLMLMQQHFKQVADIPSA